MGNTYNRVYIWCCKYGENRYCEICANKKWCASKHTGLLNSCLGKLCLHPYLVVPLISARVTLISTRVSAHCQAILFIVHLTVCKSWIVCCVCWIPWSGESARMNQSSNYAWTLIPLVQSSWTNGAKVLVNSLGTVERPNRSTRNWLVFPAVTKRKYFRMFTWTRIWW